MDRWQAARESYSRVLAIKPDHGALEEFLNRAARTRLNAQASGPGNTERRPNRTSGPGSSYRRLRQLRFVTIRVAYGLQALRN